MLNLVEPLSLNDLLAHAVQTFGDLLPEDWEASLSRATEDPYLDRRVAPDALLEVEAPDGAKASFAAAANMTVTGRDVAPLLAKLRRWGDEHDTIPLVLARYLSSTVRERLDEAGASYVDACGNVSIGSPSPAIVISRPGLPRDPWRRSQDRDSLNGEPAARVARALCDFEAPMPIARLIELSGASAGATYRVLDLLFAEGLAAKGRRGWIESTDWQRLLRRWAADWVATERRFTLRFALPDGIESAVSRLAREPVDSYLLGGAHAAAQFTGGGDAKQLLVHSEDAAALSRRARRRTGRRHDEGELTIHARGLAVAAARSGVTRKLAIASPSQAYADLMLAGDEKAAGKLLKAMSKRPSAWRAAA